MSDNKPSVGLTVGVVLAGLIPGLVVSASLLAVVTLTRAYRWIRLGDGGLTTYLVIGLGALLMLLLPAAGAALLRLRRIPSVVLSAPAMLPPLVAVGGGMLALQRAWGAVDSPSVDMSQRSRIYVEALATVLTAGMLGSVAAAVLLGSAGTCAAMRTWSRGAKPGFGLSATLAASGGLFGWILLVVAYVLIEPLRWAGFIPIVIGIGAWVAATLAGAGIANIDPDNTEQRKAAGDFATAGMSWLGAVVFVAFAVWLMLVARAFGAVAGESIEPAQKARIMAEGWSEAGQAFAACILFVVPVGLPFLGAQLGKLRLGLKGAVQALAVSLPIVLAVALPAGLLALQTTRLPGMLVEAWSAQEFPGLRLPTFRKTRSSYRGAGCFGIHTLEIRPASLKMKGYDLGSPALLDTDAGCDKVARQAVAISEYGMSIAADASMPYRRVRCLAAAIARTEKIPDESWPSGSKPAAASELSYWRLVVEDHTGRDPVPAPFDKAQNQHLCAVLRVGAPTTPRPAPWLAIDLRADNCTAKKESEAGRRFTGAQRYEQMTSYLGLSGFEDGKLIVISADDNLSAGDVLPVVGASFGRPPMAPVDRALP